jgi:hypothetical protein
MGFDFMFENYCKVILKIFIEIFSKIPRIHQRRDFFEKCYNNPLNLMKNNPEGINRYFFVGA